MLSSSHSKKVIAMGSKIREMFELANKFKAEGKKPLDFSLGNPDIKPSQSYYTALKETIQKSERYSRNLHSYMPNPGYPKTRSRVASDLSKKLKISLKKEDIYMTVGSANAIDIILETLIEPLNAPLFEKEEVICIAPYFVEYPHYIMNNQGELVVVHSDKNFNLDLKSIEKAITKKTKAIIINSPNNPTGAVYSKKSLSGLADLLENKNKKLNKEIAVIEDAAYAQLVFGKKRFNSIFPHYKHSFYTSSFSKSLGLAGERIGYLAINPKIGENSEDRKIFLEALAINLRTRVINAPATQQKVIQKIGCNVKGKIKKYEKRVNNLSKILKENGFKFQEPKGGFYLFPEIPDIFRDLGDFMNYAHSGYDPLLFVPGPAFSAHGGEKYSRHIRLSGCVSEKEIQRIGPKLEKMINQKIKANSEEISINSPSGKSQIKDSDNERGKSERLRESNF